ncbi:cupin domain-containing protein [Sandarakinorhabdus rubra]|uniref:cupin domain-containing protein n=1 Tax=Sandarakinorhabdus rubra TaxID=2672568 RepID=UPI0013DD7173|nr:cupin domain-containing protein [Sandarakinorhabdus rubra]
MPKIDPATVRAFSGDAYPPPYGEAMGQRSWQLIGRAGGLTSFGANLMTLQPGAWSSHRHWHSHEDEMVVMISGEAVLVENEGETVLCPGDIACFPAGVANGHHLQNRSSAPCSFLAVGPDRGHVDECHYPDIDLHLEPGGFRPKRTSPA